MQSKCVPAGPNRRPETLELSIRQEGKWKYFLYPSFLSHWPCSRNFRRFSASRDSGWEIASAFIDLVDFGAYAVLCLKTLFLDLRW